MKLYGTQAGMYWFINDHLGTPQKIVNSSAQVVWSAAYLPFGKAQVKPETVENNLRFPGQYFDAESGLHYNWHRYYDPETGRYVTADPIGLEGGINLYVYVMGNPVNRVDPSGLAVYYCTGIYDTYLHATVCVDKSCSGLMPSGADLWGILGNLTFGGDGQIEKAPFVANYCSEVKLSDECCNQEKFEKCVSDIVKEQFKKGTVYSLWFHNCINWANAVINYCKAKACGGL